MTDRIVWQFSYERDISGVFIKWGTRSCWSHVDAVMEDGSLLGARIKGGVQIRKPDYAPFTATQKYCIKTELADKFYDALRSQVGKPYDWRAIISFALGDRDWRETDSWFCSELQIWAAEVAGFFDRKLLIEVDRLSPRDHLLLFSPWLELIE